MFFKRNTAVVKFLFSRGNVKNHSSIREDDVHVETNNIECSQLNTLSYNNLLSLSKLHHHSSSTSLSYAVSSFNSLYKPITFSFDSDISGSRVNGMDKTFSACVDKVVSKLQFSPQFIQTQLTQSNNQ